MTASVTTLPIAQRPHEDGLRDLHIALDAQSYNDLYRQAKTYWNGDVAQAAADILKCELEVRRTMRRQR